VTTPLAHPISPPQRWRAILLATLLLAPAVWSVLIGLVAAGADGEPGAPGTAALVVGLALLPFSFVVLAVSSEHPHVGASVGRAVGLLLLVGIPVSAVAGDAVTGIVAGVGAGGMASLRADPLHDWRWRAGSVAIGAAYCFVLARTAGPIVLVVAPVFPFSGLGLADHLAGWRGQRARPLPGPMPPITE